MSLHSKPQPSAQLAAETLITPAEAAKRLPSSRAGQSLHISTVHRWFIRGDLEFVKIGGRKFTSIEALERFIHSCNRQPHNSVPRDQLKAQDGTAAARSALQKLEKMKMDRRTGGTC